MHLLLKYLTDALNLLSNFLIKTFYNDLAYLLRKFRLNSVVPATYCPQKKRGMKKLGYHRDDEEIFNHNIIASLSFFSGAKFVVVKSNEKVFTKSECVDQYEVKLSNLDLCFMVGKDFQNDFFHSVQKVDGYRVNLTFRHTLKDAKQF